MDLCAADLKRSFSTSSAILEIMDALIDSPVERVLELVAGCFTAEVADRLVALKFDDALQAQLDELAEKANEGQLSEEEKAHYLSYIEIMDFVALLQLKARKLRPCP